MRERSLPCVVSLEASRKSFDCGLSPYLMPTFGSLLSTTEYFEEHFLFYSCMLNSKGMPSFRDRMLKLMVKGIHEQLNMSGINKGMNREILVQFMASAIVGIVEWWIHNKMPVPANELARELWTLLERNQIHNSTENE